MRLSRIALAFFAIQGLFVHEGAQMGSNGVER